MKVYVEMSSLSCWEKYKGIDVEIFEDSEGNDELLTIWRVKDKDK